MDFSIWIGSWDLEGRNPIEVIDFLKSCGLNHCNLAFTYHGGRMLLPGNLPHLVCEQHPGALYYRPDQRRFKRLRLKPAVSPQWRSLSEFVSACARRSFPVTAWLVLCHNEYLGGRWPNCCLENIYGDRYTYALCPSNPDVQEYVLAVCEEVASYAGVVALDLEALGFMGYSHASLHDKCGVRLLNHIRWLLSICVCSHCTANLGADSEEIQKKARTAVRKYLKGDLHGTPGNLNTRLERIFGRKLLNVLLEMRHHVLRDLLVRVRSSTRHMPLFLRLSTDPLFYGGKAALGWDDLRDRVDGATLSFFGFKKRSMANDLKGIPDPSHRPVRIHGGIVFHYPDSAGPRDLQSRLKLLQQARVDRAVFYSFSLAAPAHFRWLRTMLSGGLVR